ncbi:hypothetical protein BHM03_00008335, partial [Ensete ventricosum]
VYSFTMCPHCISDFCRKGKQKRKLSGSIWSQAGCLMLSLKHTTEHEMTTFCQVRPTKVGWPINF